MLERGPTRPYSAHYMAILVRPLEGRKVAFREGQALEENLRIPHS